MQNALMLTNIDVAPMVNASKSVIDVIVIATPLFFDMNFILSFIVAVVRAGASANPDISMNMSSISIPVGQFHISLKIVSLYDDF